MLGVHVGSDRNRWKAWPMALSLGFIALVGDYKASVMIIKPVINYLLEDYACVNQMC